MQVGRSVWPFARGEIRLTRPIRFETQTLAHSLWAGHQNGPRNPGALGLVSEAKPLKGRTGVRSERISQAWEKVICGSLKNGATPENLKGHPPKPLRLPVFPVRSRLREIFPPRLFHWATEAGTGKSQRNTTQRSRNDSLRKRPAALRKRYDAGGGVGYADRSGTLSKRGIPFYLGKARGRTKKGKKTENPRNAHELTERKENQT